LAGFVDFHVWCPVRVQEQFSGALFRACPNPFFAALVFLSARSQLRSATGVLIFFGLSLHRPTCFSRLIFHSRFVSLYRLNFVCASWPGPDPASRARSFFDFRYRNRSTWQIPRSARFVFSSARTDRLFIVQFLVPLQGLLGLFGLVAGLPREISPRDEFTDLIFLRALDSVRLVCVLVNIDLYFHCTF
jgi:hypothetical protein